MKRVSVILLLLTVSVVTGAYMAPVRAQNSCIQGDTNGDGQVTIADYNAWRQEYLKLTAK